MSRRAMRTFPFLGLRATCPPQDGVAKTVSQAFVDESLPAW